MNPIRKWLYDNRKRIMRLVLFIVGIIVLTQLLNYFAKNKQDKTDVNEADKALGYAVMSESPVSDDIKNEISDIIDNFFDYCNKGEIEKAYNMLSSNCKEKVYTSLDVFKRVFYDSNFETNKEHSIQAWVGDTYKVKIYEDMLATGISVQDSLTTENYFTLVEENSEKKLNINGYVKTKEFEDIKGSTDNIEVEILQKDIYVDYEVYRVKVRNISDKDIMLDSKENTKGMYITNDRDVMFTAFSSELNINKLTIDSGAYKTIDIRFNNNYKIDKEIKSITFSQILLDLNDKTKTEKLIIKM
ncbi:MAG: hypothetical protein Q4G05_01805 [Clostridia bacterium]|nr:hypothetical protein [Clostridia bacterium]